MSTDCLFCKIAAGEIPATKVYEDDQVVAFEDIQPVAPVHVLVIPRKHIASVNDLRTEDSALLGSLFAAIQRVAQEKGVAESGFRVVSNSGKDSGQAVFHLHFHVIGGRQLGPLA